MAISVLRMAQGSKESIECEVIDETGQITTLVGTSPTFIVKTDLGATQQSGSCSVTGMILQAIVDSSSGGGWALGHYNLYFSWTVAGETPIEGPFDLYIV